MNTLIVDDKSENRYFLEVLLKGARHTTFSAANGAEAMEHLTRGGIDLIISDILMPVMDGFELCRKVKTDESLRSIPFIIYTATYTGPQDEEFALRIGADRFILKPCEPDVFLEAVSDVMSASGRKETSRPQEQPQEEEVLKLYNERLVRKLEQKMMQLENEAQSRKAAEESLKSQLEFLSILIDTIPVPIYYKDENGVYRGCNSLYASTIMGLAKEEIIGRRDEDLGGTRAPELARRYHEEDLLLMRIPEFRSYEQDLACADGLTRNYIVNKSILSSSQGRITGIVCVMQDITKRKQIENDLRRNKNYIEKIVNSINEGISVLDTVGRHEMVNPALCSITGYGPDELLGVGPPFPYWPKEETKVLQDSFKNILQGDIQDFHLVFKRKNDQRFPALVSPSIIRDENGNILNFTITVRDLTEFTYLETQLRQAQKMEAVGQLTGGIAHDFNNLLLPILGYSDLLLTEIKPQNPYHQEILHIKRAGERAKDLIAQLLAFSRKQVLEMKNMDLRDVINDFHKILRRTLREDISIRLLLSSKSNPVVIDASRIGQILMNLAVNAQDAMPKGGTITIATTEIDMDETYASIHPGALPGAYVMLSFSDTGCGMERQTIERLFEPFFTTKEPGKGTGLGLSTVFGIVKQHNGYIMVYSEPDMGTTFKIYLPKAAGEEPSAGETSRKPDIRGGTETIIVVEDDDTVRALISRILRKCGYSVTAFSNALECLQAAERNPMPIHLLLTDVIMPEINGRQLHDRLSAIFPGLKVIFMSGYPYDVIAKHGVLIQGIHFISKPFTARDMTEMIRSVLDEDPAPA